MRHGYVDVNVGYNAEETAGPKGAPLPLHRHSQHRRCAVSSDIRHESGCTEQPAQHKAATGASASVAVAEQPRAHAQRDATHSQQQGPATRSISGRYPPSSPSSREPTERAPEGYVGRCRGNGLKPHAAPQSRCSESGHAIRACRSRRATSVQRHPHDCETLRTPTHSQQVAAVRRARG